jgi:hypothetical protein
MGKKGPSYTDDWNVDYVLTVEISMEFPQKSKK